MLFDTDVLIWLLRGNLKAVKAVDDAPSRVMTPIIYMELLQGARSNAEMLTIKSFLSDLQFATMPLTENIGHRATIYMEEYSRSSGLSMADALIASAAIENNLPLLTANEKLYKVIRELQIVRFRP